MDFDIKGKVALVTGPAKALGPRSHKKLTHEDCRVTLIARNVVNLQSVAASLEGAHANEALALRCDVTSASAVNAAVACANQQFGGIDIRQ